MEKQWPWYPDSLRNSSHIQDLKDWGFNTLRLGFMWSGAEPIEGQFNYTYFKIMGDIVDDLAAHGIHAFLDVHQDVLSSYFCLYDGAPQWLVDYSAESPHPFPWPLEWDGTNPCPWTRGWSQNYFAEATGLAFQGLYSNHNNMRDKFSLFIAETAKYFKNKPILGYEIINEPWAGDIYSQPSLLLPGQAGYHNLQPFYDVVSASIRAEDPDRLIFYEPVTWGMILNGTVLGSGFTHVPGGDDFRTKSGKSGFTKQIVVVLCVQYRT